MSTAPWYKEKLSSKCFREHDCKKERYSDALNTQRWRFLKSGLDDFRAGGPPPSGPIIIRGKKGPIPVILHHEKTDPSQKLSHKPWDVDNQKNISFSRLSPSQRMRRDYIAQAERSLARHPLALYPHLEESVLPEIFCDVVRLLDPEMYHSRRFQVLRKSKDTVPSLQYSVESEIKREMKHGSADQFWKPKTRNPYTWFSKKDSASREDATRIGYVPPLDENIKQITKEFCEWVNAMGGDQYNIDEATVLKLFDTRYETKAVLSTPIKIVELYHVPAELKRCMWRPSSQPVYKRHAKTPSEPKLEKMKYGAWYLHPKKWKKQKVNEKQAVPDILQNFLNVRKYGKREDEEKPLHGIYAFDRFLELKGYRKPAAKHVTNAKAVHGQRRRSKTPKKKKDAEVRWEMASQETRKKLLADKKEEFKTIWFPYRHF